METQSTYSNKLLEEIEAKMSGYGPGDKSFVHDECMEMYTNNGWKCVSLKPNVFGEVIVHFHRPRGKGRTSWHFHGTDRDGNIVDVNVVTFFPDNSP